MTENLPLIKFLTDEVIDQYGKFTITESRDINLRFKDYYHPWKRGLLDPIYFGSLYSDRCNCGRVRKVSSEPCPICKSRVLGLVESFSRYAKIELPVYYTTSLKFEQLYKFLTANFRFEFQLDEIDNLSDLSKNRFKAFNLCQFNYDEESNIITCTTMIDDVSRCSFEGLELIILEHRPELHEQFRSYVNKKILVVPLILRPVHKMVTAEGEKLNIHEITKVYQNIIFACETFYKQQEQVLEKQHHLALVQGALRLFITQAMDGLSNLMRSSKQNLARTMQADRLENSGRCTIIPGPNLRIDEVELPIHLYYEACKKEFTQFLERELNTSYAHAQHLVSEQALSEEVQKLFKLFVEGDAQNPEEYPGKLVIINRAPTLHEYNLMAMKVKLTKADTMSLPIALCKPFNADFDGDTMAWYDVPRMIAPTIESAMSPKNMFFYKINMVPLFLPTQEVMQGLILATKVRIPADGAPEMHGDSIEELEKYRLEHRREFKYQTLIQVKGEETTLARMILSKEFNCDINMYTGGLDKTLNSKNIPFLYDKLCDLPDRVERILNIQKFALKIVTIAGVTSVSLKDLYCETNSEVYKEMEAVEESPILSEAEKGVKMRELYRKFLEESQKNLRDDVRVQVEESCRAKTSQLLNIFNPRVTTSVKGEIALGKSTLVEGMTEDDLVNLAVENRATQDIKGMNVPAGGYFTRQLVYLASAYSYQEGESEGNTGIKLQRKDAVGRTLVSGEVVTPNSSTEEVLVRSIVTANKDRAWITKDLISNKIKYSAGSKIGLAMITSFSQGLTQGMLALKHGGNLFVIDEDCKLVAPDKIDSIQTLDNFLLVNCGSKQYRYPKPADWVQNYSSDGKYQKGEVIGCSYHPVTPSYKLDCFVQLCKARKVRAAKRFAKNEVEISCCFSINEGLIRYDLNRNVVKIGEIEYPYSETSMYFLPEGTKVEKFQRICSGTIDFDWYLRQLGDYVEGFYLFRAQVAEMASVAPELIEFFYTLIVQRNKNGALVNKGVINSIHSSNSFFTEVAFEDYKKAFKKLTPEGVALLDDTFGRSFLPVLLNSLSIFEK